MQEAERRAGTAEPVPASVRLVTRAGLLGFVPPPVSLRLKLLRGPLYWSLFLQPEAGARVAALVEWLEPWAPLRLEFGSRRVLRADFDPVPPVWAERFGAVELRMLVLHPNGSATATVVGTHAALGAFGRALSSDPVTKVRDVRDMPRDAPLLTRAQEEALRAAVEAGYYRIPRPVNLRQLAVRLGISAASLSERLRRAEARVILRYAKDGAMTPWDAHTLFSVHVPEDRGGDDDPVEAFEVAR